MVDKENSNFNLGGSLITFLVAIKNKIYFMKEAGIKKKLLKKDARILKCNFVFIKY